MAFGWTAPWLNPATAGAIVTVMDPAERSAHVERLRVSRDVFLAAVAGISDEQAVFKPAADCWFVAEIAEHIAVTEHGMYRLITKYFAHRSPDGQMASGRTSVAPRRHSVGSAPASARKVNVVDG